MGVVVYMTGAWDLLHIGHMRALQRAREMGDCLVVGVMTDDFVIRSKGKKPIIPLGERIEMVRALGCVDFAVEVNGHADFYPLDTFRPGIRAVGPDYGEHGGHTVALEEMEGRGISVRVIPKTRGLSTTIIAGRIRDGYGDR